MVVISAVELRNRVIMLVVWCAAGVVAAFFETAKLRANDTTTGDSLGHSVAISGNLVVVGSPDDGSSSGSASIFRTTDNGISFGQTAKLTASDAATGDRFGSSVAVSGNIVVVGADGNDDAGAETGSAYTFVSITTAAPSTLTPAPAPAGGPTTMPSNNGSGSGTKSDKKRSSSSSSSNPTKTRYIVGRDEAQVYLVQTRVPRKSISTTTSS